MQKNRISDLSVSINSRGRFNLEKNSSLISPYQRDRDRIVHSTAFRRLKHKTQVFVNTSDDHYRTRITHSLEVSQIARTLGKFFELMVLSIHDSIFYFFQSYNSQKLSELDGCGTQSVENLKKSINKSRKIYFRICCYRYT